MATLANLTLCQSNDDNVDLVITPVSATDDLSLVTDLVFLLKPDACTGDTDSTVTRLSTSDPTQIVITTQTAALIEATVYVPASATAEPYQRVWRVDAYIGTTHRTALYGTVTVIDL